MLYSLYTKSDSEQESFKTKRLKSLYFGTILQTQISLVFDFSMDLSVTLNEDGTIFHPYLNVLFSQNVLK